MLTNGPYGDAARHHVDLVARLRPGTAVGAVTAALQAVVRRAEAEAGAGDDLRGSVVSGREFAAAVTGPVRSRCRRCWLRSDSYWSSPAPTSPTCS